MIQLYGFGSALGLLDPSPFVMKVDAWLRMTGLPYRYIAAGAKALRSAPKGKLPYIEDGGQCIADSHFIIAHLTQHYPVTLDTHLRSEQRAQAHCITRLLSEDFYWAIVYSRWQDHTAWPTVKASLFRDLPAPLQWFVPSLVRRGAIASLHKQGTGRHHPDEILALSHTTLESLSQCLGHQRYFLGEHICSADASAYAFLSTLINAELDGPLYQQARRFDNLVAYCQRIADQYYTDVTNSANGRD